MAKHDDLEWEWHVVSHHEAGHAVANIALELGVREVSVSVSGGILGGISSSGDTVGWIPDTDDTDGIDRRMVSDMCGPAAEARWYMEQGYRSRKAWKMARGNATGDYNCADTLTEHSTIDVGYAEQLAADLVEDYWDAIVDVAEALRDNDGYLSGGEVESIVASVAA
jgi:hypothetical protein